METVQLNLKKGKDRSYDILIGSRIMDKIPLDLKRNNLGNRYLIITDSNLEGTHGKRLLSLMRKEVLSVSILSFKAGEKSKNLKVYGKLIEKLHELKLDRKSTIIALGGGVVGDISGFVAATYMRGINYIQVPTSLLATVDSSIGGKVAVDLSTGKNIVGAFYQPRKVYIDVSLLKGLPRKEILNGLSEAIKHALIMDKKLFNFIKKNLDNVLHIDEKTLIELVRRNCNIKANIVESDETESGLRKILNYGHTIGHALETLTGYSRYSHGEAIAIGMVVEGLIANKIGILSDEELRQQNGLIRQAGLPTKLPNINTNRFVDELKKDKKVVDGRTEFVLLREIGKAEYGVHASTEIIKKSIDQSK